MRPNDAVVLLIAGLVLALSSACASRAAADEGQPSYDETIEIALGHYRAHDWAAARSAFERANAIESSARALRGLALSAYYAKDYATAASAFEGALAQPQRPLSPEQRSQVEQLLQQTYGFVAQVDLDLQPANALVRLNQQSIPHGKHLLLAPGHYQLEASLAGYASYAEELELKAGQQLRLRVTLVAEPAAVELPLSKAADARVPPSDVQRVSPIAPLTVGGATLALSATVLIFGIMANNEFDDLEQRCRQEGCSAGRRAALWDDSPIATYETVTNVALAAAVGSAIATATLVVLYLDSSATARPPVEATASGPRLSLHF